MKNYFLIITMTFFYSCNEINDDNNAKVVKFNEVHELKKSYYDGGVLRQEYQVNLIGQKDGYFNDYYENGTLKKKSFYKYDVLDSTEKWYYRNETLRADFFYLEGERFGTQKLFDSTGNLEQVYFVTSHCDSCVNSIFNFKSDGSIKDKKGALVHCIYEKDKIQLSDTAKMIFYVIDLPFFTHSAEIVEEKIGEHKIAHNCSLGIYNNNQGYLFMKKFEEVGRYNVGLVVKSLNTKTGEVLSDSVFVQLSVR